MANGKTIFKKEQEKVTLYELSGSKFHLFSEGAYSFIIQYHCRPIKTDFDSSLLLTGLLSVVSFYNFSIFKSKPP